MKSVPIEKINLTVPKATAPATETVTVATTPVAVVTVKEEEAPVISSTKTEEATVTKDAKGDYQPGFAEDDSDDSDMTDCEHCKGKGKIKNGSVKAETEDSKEETAATTTVVAETPVVIKAEAKSPLDFRAAFGLPNLEAMKPKKSPLHLAINEMFGLK